MLKVNDFLLIDLYTKFKLSCKRLTPKNKNKKLTTCFNKKHLYCNTEIIAWKTVELFVCRQLRFKLIHSSDFSLCHTDLKFHKSLGFMPSLRSTSISFRFDKIFPTALKETSNFNAISFLGVCEQTSLFENHKNSTGRLLNLSDHHRG